MSKNRLRPLSERISRPESAVNALARRTGTMLELAAELRTGLPPALSGALRAANLREDGTLILSAASPAWAARLRFEAPKLLARCRERHPQVKRMKVRAEGGGAGRG